MIDPQIKEYAEVAVQTLLAVIGFAAIIGVIIKFVFKQYQAKDLELKKANKAISTLKDSYQETQFENMKKKLGQFGFEIQELKTVIASTNTNLALYDDRMTRLVNGTEELTQNLAEHSQHVVETFAKGQIKMASIEKDVHDLEDQFGEAKAAFALAEKTYREVRADRTKLAVELDKARKTLLKSANLLSQAKQEYDRIKIEAKNSKLVKVGPNNYIFKQVDTPPASKSPTPVTKKSK